MVVRSGRRKMTKSEDPTPPVKGSTPPLAEPTGMVVILNAKHVKQLGKEEYRKAYKALFKGDQVDHVDIVMSDGGVVRFIR